MRFILARHVEAELADSSGTFHHQMGDWPKSAVPTGYYDKYEDEIEDLGWKIKAQDYFALASLAVIKRSFARTFSIMKPPG